MDTKAEDSEKNPPKIAKKPAKVERTFDKKV
jgi:hypothetical protein